MKADAIAGLELGHASANRFNNSRDFMAERQRQRINARFAGAIMRIRMTDSGGLDSHEDVIRPDVR